ncbi:hypothetical protein [Arachnia rubra]|nr:hypothetical protein [Arachnia rubra]MDO4646205.1 hypothetical protein [Propionibacteriaceae bacterium]
MRTQLSRAGQGCSGRRIAAEFSVAKSMVFAVLKRLNVENWP